MAIYAILARPPWVEAFQFGAPPPFFEGGPPILYVLDDREIQHSRMSAMAFFNYMTRLRESLHKPDPANIIVLPHQLPLGGRSIAL